MPGCSARAKITAQAQGIPLFAVETVRALIDRDIVQPIEGSYRLVGEVGQLQVPDSLHGLLAARLDALDPGVRRLVNDAAVLGTTFPAEALIAVSGQDEAAVRAGLGELVRREVLTVSADPLSPEKGSYSFAQQMLRQVAYDTLSRRDCKTRHLAVAAHLRDAFPGDGEEVAEVIARHYLDALDAVPGAPDAETIRGQAIAALVRAAQRNHLAVAVENLAQALLMTGDWDGAEAELAQALGGDALADIEHLACYRAWLAALRGGTETAQTVLARLTDLRATEDPQDQATIAVVEAFTAAPPRPARRRASLRPRRPRPRRRPGNQPRVPAVGVAAGRPRRARPRRHRHRQRPARDARRLPARATGPDAARRT